MKSLKIALISISTTILLALVYCLSFSPVGNQAVFQTIPHNAFFAGSHFNVRNSWRSQLSAPVVKNFLSAYGLTPNEIADQPGVFWTFFLAIDNFLATASTNPYSDPPSLYAASPASYREPLLRLFLALRWIPGLDRLSLHPDKSCLYVNIASKNAEKPLYLILDVHNHIVLAKLAPSIENLDDMKSSSPHPSFSYCPPSPETAHLFQITPNFAKEISSLPISSNTTVSVSFPKNELTIDASLPLDTESNLYKDFKNYFSSPLFGGNAKASALAADHAIALTLLPSSFSENFLGSEIPLRKELLADNDLIAYLTTSPYGCNLFGFSLPALTIDVPGLSMDKQSLSVLLTLFDIPHFISKQSTIQNGSTICSSAASLRKQMESTPSSSASWKTAFANVASLKPSCFFYFDLDPFFLSADYLLGALQTASSFGAIRLRSNDSSLIHSFRNSLPITPTYSSLSLAYFFPSSNLRLSLSIK